jgi:site-specific recombinase XerD
VFDATVSIKGLAGSASQIIRPGVALLDPAPATFDEMLHGWALQQRARQLKATTVSMRTAVVRRFAEFTNEYPWSWTAADAEAFTTQTHTAAGIAVSTARGHQNALRMFMEYLCDPRYSWSEVCAERFGTRPVQILHEWNSVVHSSPYEGSPGRRPLSYDEVQALFDAADSLAEQIRARGRKGASAAQRDATLLKVMYAYGLRRREAWGLEVEDLRHNPRAPGHGRFGAIFVRWGKSSNGSPPKRRTVLLVPEMDWVVPVLESWLDEVRQGFVEDGEGPLWVTERQTRLSPRSINAAFTNARDAAGLPAELDLHSLRHSYVTHLVEFDYPERFVQDQVGHVFASTTAIYTGVSDEYRNRLLQRSMDRNAPRWEA